MTLTGDLLAFAATRLPWEQDLFRRVYTQPDLTPTDLDEVFALIKAGASIPQDVVPPAPIALAPAHVLHRPEGAPAVVLGEISNVRNAMQLASGQRLSFSVDGVTVVYGENGSGKSGYCKLLKQICRARRERADEVVLENAYSKGVKGKPSLNVRYKVGDDPVVDQEWTTGDPPPEALSRITVFDSRLAPLYADKQDKIEFLPAGLDVLPRIVKACEELTQRLNAEIAPLRKAVSLPLPEMIAGTAQAEAVAKLTEKTPAKQIPTVAAFEALAAWTILDDDEVLKLEDEIRSDPAARAKERLRGSGVVSTFASELQAVDTLLSADGLKIVSAALQDYLAAKDASELAASAEFNEDPFVASIGTDPWRQMFTFAMRVYSETYEGAELPTHGDTEVCPLCAQALSSEAFERLTKFRELVSNAAAEHETAKKRALTDTVGKLVSLKLSTAAQVATALAPFAPEGSAEAALAIEISDYLAQAEEVRKIVVREIEKLADVAALMPMAASISLKVSSWASNLAAQANADMLAAADPERMVKLRSGLRDLKGRKLLGDHLQVVLARRSHLIEISQLSACIAQRHTGPISSKNTELCEKHLTEDFRRKLVEEIRELGIDYLPVEVRGRTEKGVSYVGPDLTKSIAAKTSNILSEGEFRALSLACFFAEIGSIDGHNAIILDDPVSSLDHKHVRQVVDRILKEAKRRQVIVFTHELSFYYELWHGAAQAGVPLTRHWIVKTDEHGFGTVKNGDSPWQAKSTKDRLAYLDQKLTTFKTAEDKQSEGFERGITDFYTALRETWERLVEEMLLNGVVGRFQPGVSTLSLAGVEVSENDYKAVYFGMSRTSELSGHDWSKGRLPSVPSHDEMAKELQEIRTYFGELKKRREDLQSKRRKLTSAPTEGELLR